MKREEFNAILSRPAIARRNPIGGQPSGAVAKQHPRSSLQGSSQNKTRHPRKCLVRVTCYRVRKQDPDNGVYKFHIDALRHAGLVDDDTADAIDLQVSQQKVQSRADERTEITIERTEVTIQQLEPLKPKACPHDPRKLAGAPIGQYHCPVCGEMVIAGMEH